MIQPKTLRGSTSRFSKDGGALQQAIILQQLAAYDAFAPWYRSYADTRRPYLQKIEEIVIAHALGARSLLDVGSGDGSRALRIARSASVPRVVLIEPSAGMRAQCPGDVEVWPCAAQEIPRSSPQFDLITCLWNVLGHLPDGTQRLMALTRLRQLLSSGGAMFLDVSHRYNGSAYGWTRTFLRMLQDFAHPSEERGNVMVSWKAGGRAICTAGHVFTDTEMKRLFFRAGLKVVKRWVVSYKSGAERTLSLCGHLLYQLAVA